MREKKNIVLFVNVIVYIILIGVIINLLTSKNLILGKDKQIVKEMSETEQVTNLENEINDLNSSKTEYSNYINTSKINLAQAITNAGVLTSGTDSFETMITNVSNILSNKTNDATATATSILSGKTAYVKGSKVTGTMANKGAVTQTLNAGGSYTIPAGYHNGSGKVTSNSLASQTQATATADNITEGKTAWVNGNLITGTQKSNISSSYTLITVAHSTSYSYGDLRSVTKNFGEDIIQNSEKFYFQKSGIVYLNSVLDTEGPFSTISTNIEVLKNGKVYGEYSNGVSITINVEEGDYLSFRGKASEAYWWYLYVFMTI